MRNSRGAFGLMGGMAALLLAGFCLIHVVRACGPVLSLRAYLTRSFWQPIFYPMDMLAARIADNAGSLVPYAGFLPEEAPAALGELREAYQQLATAGTGWQRATQACARALAPGILSGIDLEEARLIDCKISLRLAAPDTNDLVKVRSQFEDFIKTASNKAFISEARGWLARVFYLQGDCVRAVRIYLDELESAVSPLSRDTLVSSIRWAYSKGGLQFWEQMESFFDTPRHALFIVNLATNPESEWVMQNEGYSADERGRKVLNLLKGHAELFKQGEDSEALAMALMRASLFIGDPGSTLKYAAAVLGSKNLQQNPEFNWMMATACFVTRDYARAELPLQRMLGATSATVPDRRTAAQGLIGVYLKTGRRVDALHAALIQESTRLEPWEQSEDFQSQRAQWSFYGLNLDLPYLLDALLTEGDLRSYLKKYPKAEDSASPLSIYTRHGHLSDSAIVQYSIAVRLARREQFEEAGAIFRELGFDKRAGLMEGAAGYLARTKNANLTPAERLAAQFDYGEYIAWHPNELFFNDLLWKGFQRHVFLQRYDDPEWTQNPRLQPGLTRRERTEILASDRKLRDEQEERWKAFKVFEPIPDGADPELGRKAALKIIDCLRIINSDRFGRGREIKQALSKWRSWLRTHPAQPTVAAP